jgi:hypothetical protein
MDDPVVPVEPPPSSNGPVALRGVTLQRALHEARLSVALDDN